MGKRHGTGVETYYSMKGRYTGEWVNGTKEGKGTEIYKNGDVYEGQFKSNLKEGEGEYKWYFS